MVFEKSSVEIASNKLYILYALKQANAPLPNALLTHIFMYNDILDFFTLQQNIAELRDSQLLEFMTNPAGEFISITKKGMDVLHLFESRISFTIRETIHHYIQIHSEDLLFAMDRVSRSHRKEDGMHVVELELHNENRPYISLHLEVANNALAQQICSNWNRRSSEIYFEIIQSLTKNGKDNSWTDR